MGEIRMTRDFILWCMAVVYLCAFTSLYVQIPGLYYENGMLPARLAVQPEAKSFYDLFFNQPSLLRLVAKIGISVEAGMDLLSLGGVILSFVAMVCRSQRNTITFALLWTFYLSLFQVGQTFMWFQWDILLLEVGFLTIFLAPLHIWGIWKGRHHQHDKIIMWLMKWLLFRLMFASGVVKLQSQCKTWWGLTATMYHYETQCIPSTLAWYAHQLPEWMQKLSVVIMFVIEMVIPFLFFSPVRGQRIFSFYAQVLFQLLIILTGNYNFFNWLTITLSFAIVDDNFLRGWLGKRQIDEGFEPDSFPVIGKVWKTVRYGLNILVYGYIFYWTATSFSLWPTISPGFTISSKIAFTPESFQSALAYLIPPSIILALISLLWEVTKAITRSLTEHGTLSKIRHISGCIGFGLVALAIFGVSLPPFTKIDSNTASYVPQSLKTLHSQTSPYKIASPYGLFRRMTGVGGRPEVIVEGSMNVDAGWREYGFLYKPGNVSTPLGQVAPHQPRLDWQMWFLALGNYQHNPWFLNMCYRILSNEKQVLDLLGHNPFPDKPPKYLRATLYHYHYTSIDEGSSRYSADDTWVRTSVREYLPVISTDEPSFINYLTQASIIQKKKQHIPTDPPTFLTCFLSALRNVLGQPEGFYAILALVFTGLALTFLDPSVKLLHPTS